VRTKRAVAKHNATLTGSARDEDVSRHVAAAPRNVAVPIRLGRSVLRLACSLRSRGGVVRGTHVAVRGR